MISGGPSREIPASEERSFANKNWNSVENVAIPQVPQHTSTARPDKPKPKGNAVVDETSVEEGKTDSVQEDSSERS
jgi:hypothetical protein